MQHVPRSLCPAIDWNTISSATTWRRASLSSFLGALHSQTTHSSHLTYLLWPPVYHAHCSFLLLEERWYIHKSQLYLPLLMVLPPPLIFFLLLQQFWIANIKFHIPSVIFIRSGVGWAAIQMWKSTFRKHTPCLCSLPLSWTPAYRKPTSTASFHLIRKLPVFSTSSFTSSSTRHCN